jgi:hypothetical protein
VRPIKSHKALKWLVAFVAFVFTLAALLAIWNAFRFGSGGQAIVIALSSMGAWEFWGQVRRMRAKGRVPRDMRRGRE